MRTYFSGEEVGLDDVDRHPGCISCKHVTEEGKPILYVTHAGGDWVLLCGSPHHYENDASDDELLALHIYHLIEPDETLLQVVDLPIDMCVDRKAIGGSWIFSDDKDEE